MTTNDSTSREREIREIAYQIWEQEGRPHGKEVAHYHMAEQAWEQRTTAAEVSDPAAAPRTRRTRSTTGTRTKAEKAESKADGKKPAARRSKSAADEPAAGKGEKTRKRASRKDA